jgi:small basic protein (TIGR04137 family)
MSIHPSLKTEGDVAAKRNVLKRFERIDILKKRGRRKDGDKVWGLPKTRVEE